MASCSGSGGAAASSRSNRLLMPIDYTLRAGRPEQGRDFFRVPTGEHVLERPRPLLGVDLEGRRHAAPIIVGAPVRRPLLQPADAAGDAHAILLSPSCGPWSA